MFDTSEGKRLSLSRNPQLVRSLVSGEMYAVQGEECRLRDRQYVHEPQATLLEDPKPELQNPSFIGRHVRMVSTVAAVLVITSAVGVSALVKHGETPAANANAAATQSGSSSIDLGGTVQGASTAVENQTDTTDTDQTTTVPPQRTGSAPLTTTNPPAAPQPSVPAVTPPPTTLPVDESAAPVEEPVADPPVVVPPPVEEVSPTDGAPTL